MAVLGHFNILLIVSRMQIQVFVAMALTVVVLEAAIKLAMVFVAVSSEDCGGTDRRGEGRDRVGNGICSSEGCGGTDRRG